MGRRMDNGFNRVHDEIRAMRTETRTEIAALHRLILQVGGGMVATMAIGFLGIIVTQL